MPDSSNVMESPLARLFTIDEVAARFRVSRRTLQAYIRSYPLYRLLGRRTAQALDGFR